MDFPPAQEVELEWSPRQAVRVELLDFIPTEDTTMTDDRLPLADLLQKSGEGDFLRAVAESVLQLLMEADVEGLVGAGRHERSADRLNWRNVAAIIAVAANTDGRREIIGLGIGPSEAETFWSTFLKSLVKRGLRGVKLVISDAHEGLTAAITRVVGATWQRCRVHFMRNALAHVPKGQHTVVAAAIRQAFIQPDRESAGQTWRHVADQLRPRWPKLAALMDEAEHDVLAYVAFPAQHRTKLHSTNPLERLNKEVKRRADVVGIFPN